jgi:TonB family protein
MKARFQMQMGKNLMSHFFKSKSSYQKTILTVAGVHVVVILILLFFPSFHKTKPQEKTLQWVDLPPTSSTTVAPPLPPTPAPPVPQKNIPSPPEPTPPEPVTPPVKPKPDPVTPVPDKPKPKPETPKPDPQPKPKPKPTPPKKPAPVQVDLTAVVKKTSKQPATQGNANALTKRLSDTVDSVQMKSSASTSASSSTVNRYHMEIRNALYQAWQRPTGGPRPLEAQVTLKVLPDGTIIYIRLTQSSGNAAMDNSVITATRQAGKLSKPLPQGMGSPDYEVTINFVQE